MSARKNGGGGGESLGHPAADFLFGRGEYADNARADEIWEDIIDDAIADQHAVMKAADGLPPEWESAFQQSLREKAARRAVKKQNGG